MNFEPIYKTLYSMFNNDDPEVSEAAYKFEAEVNSRMSPVTYPNDMTIHASSMDDVILVCICYAARQDTSDEHDELVNLLSTQDNLWHRLVISTVFNNAVGKVIWDECSDDETRIVVATQY